MQKLSMFVYKSPPQETITILKSWYLTDRGDVSSHFGFSFFHYFLLGSVHASIVCYYLCHGAP